MRTTISRLDDTGRFVEKWEGFPFFRDGLLRPFKISDYNKQ